LYQLFENFQSSKSEVELKEKIVKERLKVKQEKVKEAIEETNCCCWS